eukprot:SAG22_NODE_374_length_11548_cov_6.893615_7_plen_74_part_00
MMTRETASRTYEDSEQTSESQEERLAGVMLGTTGKRNTFWGPLNSPCTLPDGYPLSRGEKGPSGAITAGPFKK